MNNAMINGEVRMLVEKKFYGHSNLYAKYLPRFPATAEREYLRLCRDYFQILMDAMKEEMPALKESYKEERTESKKYHTDGRVDLWNAITNMINQIMNKLTSKVRTFGLRHRLENIAKLNRKLTVKEWKKVISKTLGIDIREDYYLGEFYKEYLNYWVEENVGLIKTLPQDSLGKMRDIVYDGFVKGMTTKDMAKAINREYHNGLRHALFIARDQTAKLNADITKAQQQDAGIKEYIWSTVGDERVRESHKRLNGKKFSWDDPPETDGGRRCHPGKDYNCRCIARPVFNLNSLELPVNQPTEQNRKQNSR